MRLRHVGVRRPGLHHRLASRSARAKPTAQEHGLRGPLAALPYAGDQPRGHHGDALSPAALPGAGQQRADQQVTSKDRPAGASRAAPIPCTTREAISSPRPDGQIPGNACRDEHHQTDPVQPGPAAGAGETAAQQQEPAEGDRVGPYQPQQRRGSDVQVTLDGGQRHADDHEVQHDHERRLGARRAVAALVSPGHSGPAARVPSCLTRAGHRPVVWPHEIPDSGISHRNTGSSPRSGTEAGDISPVFAALEHAAGDFTTLGKNPLLEYSSPLGHSNSPYSPVSGHAGTLPEHRLLPAPGDRRSEPSLPSWSGLCSRVSLLLR